MKERNIFMLLFGFSINTYYLWKKQDKPIFKLLEKYFTNKELEEFLETGAIKRLEVDNSKDEMFKEILKRLDKLEADNGKTKE